MSKYANISRSCFLFVLLCVLIIGETSAGKHLPAFAVGKFRTPTSTTSTTTTTTALSAIKDTKKNQVSSRKQFFQEVGKAGIVAAIFSSSAATSGMPSPAFALDDVAVESSAANAGVGSILASSSLRSIKRAEKQLGKMEFYAVENDYQQLKSAIRNPPFSEVRKNSFQLIRDFQGERSEQDKLQAAYEKFIASLEKMDSTASLGMRGRKLENGALLQSYDATAKALSEWIEVASSVTQAGAV